MQSLPAAPQTGLYLVSGKVQVEVKPSPKGEVTTFTVKSAMATASVRGTGFEFDGENLLVNHGSVKINDALGISHTIKGGEYGNGGSRGKMPEPVAVKKPAASLIAKGATAEDIEKAVEKIIELIEITTADIPAGTSLF